MGYHPVFLDCLGQLGEVALCPSSGNNVRVLMDDQAICFLSFEEIVIEYSWDIMDYSSARRPSSEVWQRYINHDGCSLACVTRQPKISLRSSTEVKDLPNVPPYFFMGRGTLSTEASEGRPSQFMGVYWLRTCQFPRPGVVRAARATCCVPQWKSSGRALKHLTL